MPRTGTVQRNGSPPTARWPAVLRGNELESDGGDGNESSAPRFRPLREPVSVPRLRRNGLSAPAEVPGGQGAGRERCHFLRRLRPSGAEPTSTSEGTARSGLVSRIIHLRPRRRRGFLAGGLDRRFPGGGAQRDLRVLHTPVDVATTSRHRATNPDRHDLLCRGHDSIGLRGLLANGVPCPRVCVPAGSGGVPGGRAQQSTQYRGCGFCPGPRVRHRPDRRARCCAATGTWGSALPCWPPP